LISILIGYRVMSNNWNVSLPSQADIGVFGHCGTRAYVHAVIDNFSRRILAWRVADRFAPLNSVAVLV